MRAKLYKRYSCVAIIVILPLLFGFINMHKFYVSVTQIEYDSQEASLQIISRVFIDDLERLLQERYDEDAVLDVSKNQEQVDRYIAKYFDEKMQLIVDKKIREIQFLGKKYEDDLVICFLEVKKVVDPTILEIENKILFDIFEEQQNIIHVKKNTDRKSLILEREKPKGVLKFSE